MGSRPSAANHHAELSARHEGLAHVAQRPHGVGEEHRPETGEDAVEPATEATGLDIGDLESNIGGPGLTRFGAGRVNEARRGVHAHDLALGSDHVGDLLCHVAEPTAHVKHPLARLRRMQRERPVAVSTVSGEDQMAVLREAVEQDAVPGLDSLFVGCRDLGFHGAMIGPRRTPVQCYSFEDGRYPEQSTRIQPIRPSRAAR